ncbi:hypothetical protein [Paenibacillus bovis]|uniref:Adenylyl-sulfate kinase n=1 Tax=Paenibacillus bovis TaxID=1616788 RepID=A0A172ZJK4_9BACL|nr:hypothetical protein [Paenibacillus bovis]ANF97825.1 hypothetical protein AR543_18600 [Paenibacillus bovis]
MNTKLIMVEGLPGSGKSTISQLITDMLGEQGMNVQLFQEGHLEHPADYESVACYTEKELDQLLSTYEEYAELLKSRVIQNGNDCLIPYQKIKNELGLDELDKLWNELSQKDIYELPFEQNRRIITDKWDRFQREALISDSIFVFECCFIQNPLTAGTVKYNVQKQEVIDYVMQLGELMKPLHPLIIYIDQPDIRSVFEKAVRERPKTWSDGFIDYYTQQGLGKAKGYYGLGGTIQVLEERKNIELEIFDLLNISKAKIDNSEYNIKTCKEDITKILKSI